MRLLVPPNAKVNEFSLPSPHLKTFCESINDSTQPLPNYSTPHPGETDLFFASINSTSHRNCRRFRGAFLPEEESPVAAQE
ncbi:unnamed protein product, partial [Dibothriocephalus latus]